MRSDLEIVTEAPDNIASENWVNLGTITEAMSVLSREIRRLVAERDDEVDAGR